MLLTSDLLKALVPPIKQKNIDTFLPHLIKFMPMYGIDTPQRIAGFIAQTAEESINFAYVLERADGTEYEGNVSLGNDQPGDGKRYKGRGLIQITGKKNYTALSLHIFHDKTLLTTPDLLTTPQYAVQSACWYWKDREINAVCDQPESFIKDGPHHYDKIHWMSVKVNGGLNGIDVRIANYNRARQVLNF